MLFLMKLYCSYDVSKFLILFCAYIQLFVLKNIIKV